MKLSISELERLKQEGKIRGFAQNHRENIPHKAGKNIPATKKGNKTKEWIGKNLWYWSEANKITMEKEHQFHLDRKWRFDWCFPSILVAIEYEGLMSEKSRHTTITGFTGDAEKYNAAQSLGWKVLRYTAKNYKNIISDLDKLKNK